MDFGGRKIVFKALVGSHNYNLNDETSDKDYKYFVMPTFDDLYSGKMFSTSKVGTTEDYDVHDIRKCVHLWWQANINFIEVLYTQKVSIELEFSSCYLWQNLQNLNIATMNLPYLYNACVGMYCQKMAHILKGTEGTKHLVEKYGYDTKQALHAYRVLDFLRRFRDFDWDFQKAIWYESAGVRERDFMLSIKRGEWEYDDFREMISTTNDVIAGYEKYYKEQKPNEETKERLYNLIKELVRRNM